MRGLRENLDLVGPALTRIGDALADFAARPVETGAVGVFYAISGYASDDVMAFEEYTAGALPHDRRILEAVPGEAWCDVLHLCGSGLHFDLARELDVDAVSWSVHDAGNPSLAEGRDRSRRAVMGGLDRRTLLTGSPEEAIAEATAAETTAGGKGLILAPGCSVSPEAPEQNLRAVSSIG